MPFTPSHAVVALPFVRTPLVPAAVAIGAMTPDLPLFTRNLPLPYFRTHDLAWLPATILLALVLLLVWRCVLRPAAGELSPRWLAARLPEEWRVGAAVAARETLSIVPARSRPRVSWGGLLLLLLSLAVGILTHIVWDLFTHEGRAGVAAIPALDAQWGPLPGYTWLQHGSTALGLAILAIWMTVWIVRRPVRPLSRVWGAGVRVAWWMSLPAVLVTAWILGLSAYGPLDDEFTAAHLAYRTLPFAVGLWGLVTLTLCAVVQVVRSARGPAQRGESAPQERGGAKRVGPPA